MLLAYKWGSNHITVYVLLEILPDPVCRLALSLPSRPGFRRPRILFVLPGSSIHPSVALKRSMKSSFRPDSECTVSLTPAHCIDRASCSVPLWRSAARLEEQAGATGKARALLEQGRLKNLASPELWLAAVRTEQRAGLIKASEALMAKALQVRAQGLLGLDTAARNLCSFLIPSALHC